MYFLNVCLLLRRGSYKGAGLILFVQHYTLKVECLALSRCSIGAVSWHPGAAVLTGNYVKKAPAVVQLSGSADHLIFSD